MGNTSSQEYPRLSPTSDSSHSVSSSSGTAAENSVKEPANKIHPLLSSSEGNTRTSPATTAMAQEQEQQNNLLQNNVSSQDVTMSGTGASNVNLNSDTAEMSIDSEPQLEQDQPQRPPRRRSTMILTDDPEFERLKSRADNSNQSHDSTNESSKEASQDISKTSVPVEIQWFQGGENVFITGSFTGWRKMIRLVKESDEKFSIKLRLPYGTHRFRFIVDNELRFSDYLPTATDQMGNFVNYIEIQTPQVSEQPSAQQLTENKVKKDSKLGLTQDDDDMGNGYSRFHEETPLTKQLNYVKDIPAIFTDPTVMEQYYLTLDNNQSNNQNQAWLTPPQLPPHLESVILNNYSATDKSNSSGALPIPNHVVLNHLATTSIKHNTLAVASVVRYKRKYVTQVLYAPLQ